jgi:anaerobic magnesium-protoporphyrin IX monomethyl ester cyclase
MKADMYSASDKKILLTTLHAKYSHASLALPSLAACCQDLPGVSVVIREFTVNEPRGQLLRMIMAEHADIVAFSCYIWNVEQTLRIVSDIKKIAPRTVIVLGGPEPSYGTFELMNGNPAVDFVVKGEGEPVFRRLLEIVAYCDTDRFPGADFEKVPNLFFRDRSDIAVGPHNTSHIPLDSLRSPFAAGLVDLNKPLVYYETSRGCPFSCSFCLSSVEGQVRSYSMERIRSDLLLLMQRGVTQIKLVDRTFNYDARRAIEIWQFILEHNQGSHFHFEIAADLLTDAALDMLKRVPDATFRFEIGVQSASHATLEQVNRKTDLGRLFYIVRRLQVETKIELHLDLVAGLPGETYAGFLESLQAVADLHPHQIQVEPLKVLKGSPMREIARREDYRFSGFPPYTILRNPWLSYDDIGRIETIGRLLDLFYNNGGFTTALRHLEQYMSVAVLFDRMAWQTGIENLSGRSLRRLYELFIQLTEPLVPDAQQHVLHDALFFDYCGSEMPLMGKLPSFAATWQHLCAWPKRTELPDGIDLSSGSRVKAFRYVFERDYRSTQWKESPTEITFIYASCMGGGLVIVKI